MLANYWKKGAQIGNGGTADALLSEFKAGKGLKHLTKTLDYRECFVSALRGRYGVLTAAQKELLLRELFNMERVMDEITKIK